MYTVLLVIHIMVSIALIGIVLMQRSASDGMGLSSSSSTTFMSGRAAANFLTRTTAVLATLFILTSLAMGIITARNHAAPAVSIMDKIDTGKPASENLSPAKEPAKPSVPRPE